MCNAIIITIIIITVRLYLSRYNNNIIIVGEKIIYGKIQITCIYLHTLSQDYMYLYTVDVWFDEATGERDNEKQNEEKTNHRVRHYDFRASPIFGQV